MHLPVGHQHGRADPFAWYIRQAIAQGLEQIGAVGLAIAGPGLDEAQLHAVHPAEIALDQGLGLVRDPRPVSQ